MNLQQLFQYFNFKASTDELSMPVLGLALNISQVQQGFVFFAIKGSSHDGHLFIPDAIKKGAIAIVCSETKQIPQDYSGLVLQVQDVRGICSMLASRFLQFPSQKMKMIGVTGTNGKTSVAYLTEYFMNCAGFPTAVMGTIDHHLGNKIWETNLTTPDPISLQHRLHDFQKSGAAATVMEVSSHALDQKRVEGVDYDVAIFTNLSRDHLDYHKTMKNYHLAKQRLFTDLMWKSQKTRTRVIVNSDDFYGRSLKVSDRTAIWTYGKKDCDFEMSIKDFSWEGTQFLLKTPMGEYDVETPLLGIHNVYNTVAALAAVGSFQVDLEPVIKKAMEFKGIPGRLQKVPISKRQVYVDYAHTPDALEKVLMLVKQTKDKIQKDSKIWCVFGCGGDRDPGKRPMMARIAEKYCDHVVVTSDNPRTENPEEIISQIEKGFSKNNHKKISDRQEAIYYSLENSNENDVIIIAGKGHENYQIIGDTQHPFSDYDVVLQGVPR